MVAEPPGLDRAGLASIVISRSLLTVQVSLIREMIAATSSPRIKDGVPPEEDRRQHAPVVSRQAARFRTGRRVPIGLVDLVGDVAVEIAIGAF